MAHTPRQPHTSHAHRPRRKGSGAVRSIVRMIGVLSLMAGLNITSIALTAERTIAYYTDVEISATNSFSAHELDFSLSDAEIDSYLGLVAEEALHHISTVVSSSSSLPIQYVVNAQHVDGNADFCETIEYKITHDDIEYTHDDTSITSFTTPTTTATGTWEFSSFTLSNEAAQYAHDTECNIDFIYSAWRTDTPDPHKSGFDDQERITLRIKNKMIVMNEFLPNPDTSANGLDLGDDHSNQPDGEWIELYNNSLYPYDLSGWYIEDAAGNTVSVTPSNTSPATTTAPARGWLVVYMNQAFLNNSGDTIELKNATGTVIDSYEYTGGTYCDLSPTPNATNTSSATGDCSNVAPNKSYARIPDGFGEWIDPLPTPGTRNIADPAGTSTPHETTADTETGAVAGTSTATTTNTTGLNNETATTTSPTETQDASDAGHGSRQSSSSDSTTEDSTGTSTPETASSTDSIKDETGSSTPQTASSTTQTNTTATTSPEETSTSTETQQNSTAEDQEESRSTPVPELIEKEEKALSPKEDSLPSSKKDDTDSSGNNDSDDSDQKNDEDTKKSTGETDDALEKKAENTNPSKERKLEVKSETPTPEPDTNETSNPKTDE